MAKEFIKTEPIIISEDDVFDGKEGSVLKDRWSEMQAIINQDDVLKNPEELKLATPERIREMKDNLQKACEDKNISIEHIPSLRKQAAVIYERRAAKNMESLTGREDGNRPRP